MATADKLKKYVTDIADAIRAKEGSTELINPQDFAERIKTLEVGGGSTPPSGGDVLEGEYFLAKPNGRYWKFTFSPPPSNQYVDPNKLSAEQLEALHNFCSWLSSLGVIYGAAVCSAGDPLDEFLRVDGVAEVNTRLGRMEDMLYMMLNGSDDIDVSYFNVCFFSVWKECSVKTSTVTENVPFQEYDLISFLKEMAKAAGQELTDEQALMMLSGQFMLIPATEEEYKAARREN